MDVSCKWKGKTGIPRICRILQQSYRPNFESIGSNQDICQIRRASSAESVGHRRADQDVKKENFRLSSNLRLLCQKR